MVTETTMTADTHGSPAGNLYGSPRVKRTKEIVSCPLMRVVLGLGRISATGVGRTRATEGIRLQDSLSNSLVNAKGDF